MPTALPPCALIAVTISLLTEPASTISTTSTVSRSVTRKPPLNSDLMLSRSSSEPICGPPPCTTMGFTPGLLDQHDVAGEVRGELRVAHGVAAIFHHHRRRCRSAA